MSKTLLGASIIGVSLIVAALVLVGARPNNSTPILGGITNYDSIVLGGNLTTGGVNTTSSGGTTSAALSQADFVNAFGETIYSVILYTGSTSATTLAVPASSTLTQLVPRTGQNVEFLFVNQGSANITFATSSGSTIENAGTSTVASGRAARINVLRLPNTNVEFLIEVFN